MKSKITKQVEAEFEGLLTQSPKVLYEQLIEYLGTDSPAKIELATDILGAQGQPIVSMLIREALRRRRRSKHAIRILDLVAAIGVPVDMDDWFTLSAGKGLWGKIVGEKCAEVLSRLGHARPVPTMSPSPDRA